MDNIVSVYSQLTVPQEEQQKNKVYSDCIAQLMFLI